MNGNQKYRIHSLENRSAWLKALLVFLIAAVLMILPCRNGPAQAEGEDDLVSFSRTRIEFIDNDNAAGLRPTTQQRYYIYYTSSSGSDGSNGWYYMYSPNYTNTTSWSNIRIKSFSFYYTTNNNWQYYRYDGYRIDSDKTLIFTFTYVEPVTELEMTLRWSDNGNAGSVRPSAENFAAQLWRTNSTSSAGNTQITYESLTVTDNHDDTWTLHFSGITRFQPDNSTNRYVWLTWKDTSLTDQNYLNQVKSNSYAGYMYIDLMGINHSVTTIAKTDSTLDAAITWDDASNLYGKRPTPEEFIPTLRISSSSSSVTDSNSRLVTIGENGYTITEEGNTWNIHFTDVNVKELYSQNTNYKYLWLTWEGSDYYVNNVLNTSSYGYCYSSINNLNSIRWTIRSSIVTASLTWQDNGNEYSTRPTTEEFKSSVKLLLSTTNANASSAEDVTGTDITVTDNGNNTWTLVFKDTTARFRQTSNNNKRYLFLNWSGNGAYTNESLTFAQSGVSYVDLYNYSAASAIPYTAVPGYLKLTVYWDDFKDEYDTRPDPETVNLKLYLASTTGTLSDGNYIDVTGSDFSITPSDDNSYWTVIFRNTTAREHQNSTWRYLWLTWEDGDGLYLNEDKKSYTINDSNRNPYRDLNSYSTPNITYYIRPWFVVATLNWKDTGDALGMRPATGGTGSNVFVPKLYLGSTTAADAAKEVTGSNYRIIDNDNNTWTVIFLDTTARKVATSASSNRYAWLTWTGSDVYANSAMTSSELGFTYADIYGLGTSRASYNAITKYIQIKLNWSDDNGNAAGNRPDPANFQPQLYATANVSAIPADSLPVGSDWDIKDNGDNTWILTLKDADESVVRGTNPYLWLTWTDTGIQDGPQQYFNDVRSTSGYGCMRASYSAGTTPVFYPYTKAFRIRLYWDDNADLAGLRPDPAAGELQFHLWVNTGNSAGGNEDHGGQNWNIVDNGDNTWDVYFLDSDLYQILGNANYYTWLTFTGSGSEYYISDVKTGTQYGSGYVRRSGNSFNQLQRDNTLRWTGWNTHILPRSVLATLTWHDNQDALGYRPAKDEFIPHLWLINSNSSAETAAEVTGNYEITDNEDGTWTILFKDTTARQTVGTSGNYYLWLTWDGSDQYYNTSRKTAEYGYTYASLTSSVSTVDFTARRKAFQILLHWEDGDNYLGHRPATDEFIPHVWRSNSSGGGKTEITGQNWTVRDNQDGTWLLTFPEPENLTDVAENQYYIWLTWEGSDEYFNNVKDTSFGYMRVLATEDDPWYDMTTRAKHRELPLELVWDDYGNAQNTRPDPTQFTPHLWYLATNYINGSSVNTLTEIDGLVRGEDYEIITDQDDQDKWTIRYLSIPYQYLSQSNSGTTTLRNISNYILTWDGSDEYYNQVLDSGAYGYMSVAASSYAPTVTTHLKDRSMDLTLRWSDYQDEGGYRPTPEMFTPQLYFGTDRRTNVPIDMSKVRWTITDNENDTWLIHFENVPYTVTTTSGSTNTYTYYWLTWEGSDEYWNQRTSTTSTSYLTGVMRFERTSADPSVTTYLKTRSRLIRFYWQDSQDANGWRPDPETFLANMHLWYGPSTTGTIEIPLDSVTVSLEDTSQPNYWDIRIDHLPDWYDDGNYLTSFSYYWITWDGDHYINQVRTYVDSYTKGSMHFERDSMSRANVYCYPEETTNYRLIIYWQDSNNAAGNRPDPDNFDLQLYYSSYYGNPTGKIPASDYEYSVTNDHYNNSNSAWEVTFTKLPRSVKNEDGTENAFYYYWLNWTDPTDTYVSQLRLRGYNDSYLLSRFNNNNPNSTSGSTYIYTKFTTAVKVTITWDDSSNADGSRPAKEDFMPILGYSGYNNGSNGTMIGAFEGLRYEIDDSQDARNTWVVTFYDVPMVFPLADGSEEKVYYYWFTCEGADGYYQLNPYGTAPCSISSYIQYPSSGSTHQFKATLKKRSVKDITLTLNWQDSANNWGRRPSSGSFVPHLWVGTSSEVKREIPLTNDQWEITDVTSTSWTVKFRDIETLYNGNSYYWLTWEGSDYYFNQLKNTSHNYYLRWAYNSDNPSVSVYPRKVTVNLNWQDNKNIDGKRPDPDHWQPTVWYGNTSGAMETIPLGGSDWNLTSAGESQWTVEFYGMPDQYMQSSGTPAYISYYWMTFDTEGTYISDRTESGYGELKWTFGTNTTYTVNVYRRQQPLTINLTFSDANGQVGERPEPTPESLGAHLWYGSNSEAIGEITGLTYRVTDIGNNTWTIEFDDVPTYYTNSNGTETKIEYYWLTYDGGRYFLKDLKNTFSGSHGAMYASANSTNVYNMTTYCDYYRIGTNVKWNMTTNIANVSDAEIDHSHVVYDLVDTVTGEILETWEPETPEANSYSHTFYAPKYDEDGNQIDHRRYTVVQRGTPGVFETETANIDYISGVAGHRVDILNTAQEKFYRFNFTFEDDNNALKLRPASLDYLASEVGGDTYTYRGIIRNISSTQDSYSTPIITLLSRDLMTSEELEYELALTSLAKYYDVAYTRRVDDDGVINFDYTLTLKTQPVTLQVAWDDEDNEGNWRPGSVDEYLLANGINMLSDNLLTFSPEDALEDNPNVWQKQMILPAVDADGNPIVWKLKQVPKEALRIYHAEQEAVQEPDFGGQTVTLTNIKQDNWNYAIDLYWVGYAKGNFSGTMPGVTVSNRYDIYEINPADSATSPNNDKRTYKYELNISVNSAHYDVGDLEVRMPYYIQATTGSGGTKWVAPLNPANDISVPMAPNHNDRYAFNYYIDDHGTADKGDDEIVFVNWKELTASSNIKIQVIYTLYPDEHLDTHIYELQAHGEGCAILTGNDGEDYKEEPELQDSGVITFGMDTGLDVKSFTKRYNAPQLLHYYNTSYINSSHLSKDAFDTDSFDYVAYTVYFQVNANQYSEFTLTDLPGQNGEIVSVKYSNGSNYGLNLSNPEFSADKRVWTFKATTSHGTSNPYAYRYYYVVVAYPKSDGNIILEDGRIFTRYTNEADISGTALHPQNPDQLSPPPADLHDEDALNDATFIEWGDYRWKPSGKIFYYDKNLTRNFASNGTGIAAGGQTVLEYGEDISATFSTVFYVNGDELFMDGVHEYYHFNITDNELWLNGTVNGTQTEYVKLEPGDYEITSISVTATAKRTDHNTGEPFANPPEGTFVIQAQTGEEGSWQNIRTYSWPTGDTNQSKSFSISGLDGCGYTGFRVKTPNKVNEYMNLTVSFTVKLMAASEKVQALLAEGENLTQVQMLNIAAFPMEILEPDGSWTMFTDIHREYNGTVAPGVPSHTDNMAVLVDLYGNDPDRLDYGSDVELIYDHALAQAIPIKSSVASSKNTNSQLGDSLTEVVKGNFTLHAYQTIANTNVPRWLQEMIEIREGYYYDLLPEGWVFSAADPVLVGRYSSYSGTGTGPATLVGDPEVINNYKGTNRQMVIFHVKSEGDTKNYYGGSSGFSITFTATISYEEVSLYPRGNNVAVFQGVEYDGNGNPMHDDNGDYIPQVWELMNTTTTSYYDDGDFGSSVYNIPASDGTKALRDINGDGITDQNDVLYMYSTVAPNFARSVETGVDKLIKGKSGIWQLHDVTDLDTDYQYYLSYTTTGQGSSNDVIIYDVLENAANTSGHTGEKFWKGTFVDIDVSAARAQGIDAKVYYSTATNLDENNNFFAQDSGGNSLPDSQIQMDIDRRPDLWIPYSSSAPKDQITAIAVDLRKKTDGSDMVFYGSENAQVSFVITMHSPSELPEDPEAVLAYNRPCYQTCLNSGGEPTPFFNINDRVSIELQDLKTIRLKKITRSDPLTDENGMPITEENGFTFEELPLGSVYFQLYKLTCTNASHTQFSHHTAPPATFGVSGSSSNSCWTRVFVAQTQADGVAEFKNLESGTYAIREYNPYYANSSGYSETYTYVISPYTRINTMWWSFEVNTRSRQEPEIVYRGTNYTTGNQVDSVFGLTDQEIGGITDDEDITRKVMNVRPWQALEIQKKWWPALPADSGITSIKVDVYRNGELYLKDVEITAAQGWHTWIFDLPVSSPYGTRYYYTIQETDETKTALAALGYNVVVDNNSYTSLSGPTTVSFNGTSRSSVYTQQRRMHNSTDDHLVISKYVAEGGDREKKYLFSLQLKDMDSDHHVLSGTYDYLLFRYDEDAGDWILEEGNPFHFTLDGNGTWSSLQIAHNERIVILGVPVGTNYTLTEIGADGYVQTTTAGSMTGEVKASASPDDYTTNGGTITNHVEVTNTYSTQGRTKITANKTINGRRPVYFTDNIFNYYLKEVAWAQTNAAEESPPDKVTTYRLNGSSKVLLDFSANNGKGYKVSNGGSGEITFPTIVWEAGESGYEGYRVYTIREIHMVQDPDTGSLVPDVQREGYEDGMDTTVYVVWVDLQDDQSGTLESRITYYKLPEGVYEANVSEKDTWIPLSGLSDLQFDNTYSAKGSLSLGLKKTVNGLTPEGGYFHTKTFRFILRENVDGQPGDIIDVQTNDGNGLAIFPIDDFTIDDVGSNQFFRYFLQEDALDENGWTIDSVLYNITLQITDKGRGRLGAKVDIVRIRNGVRTNIKTQDVSLPLEGEEDYNEQLSALLQSLSTNLTFLNTYSAEGQWQPGIRKLVNGTPIDTAYYTNNSFSFTLSSVSENGTETVIRQATSGTDGQALFDAVTYTETDIHKTYTYVIHETGTGGNGMTAKDTPWTITLRVDDEGEGQLTPVILSVAKDGETVWTTDSETPAPAVFDFDNPYNAEGELTINGTKVLTGRALTGTEFHFAIVDENGQTVSTGTSDGDGNITFTPIRYTQGREDKHYDYKVVEIDDELHGFTYDDLQWNLSVDVKDHGTGELEVTYQLSKPEDTTQSGEGQGD